jgi:hypothetical protein
MEGLDRRDGLAQNPVASVGEGQPPGTGIGLTLGTLKKSGTLKGARQLRDVHGFEAAIVRELTLAWLHAVTRQPMQSG